MRDSRCPFRKPRFVRVNRSHYGRLDALLDEVRAGLLGGPDEDRGDIAELRVANPGRFAWDHVLIDEAQDWSDGDRDFVRAPYGRRMCRRARPSTSAHAAGGRAVIAAPIDTATAEQRAAIAYPPVGGNVFVGAGPGTGKTFLLVERYRFLREQGVAAGRILVLTFSRRAAAELSDRLVAASFPLTEIDVRTFHGFAARVIGGGTALFRSGRLLDGLSRQIVLEAAIARTPTPAFGAAVRASRTFRTELQTVLADIARAPDGAVDGIERDASPRLRDVLAIARAAAAARAAIGGNEIGELVSRAVRDARRPDSPAARWLRGRYAHVLVDEFQDTDRVQLELLAALDCTIFAVGDEAQSVYRFRGASNDIVADAVERFAMRRFDLTQSRRCPPDVCALAARTPIPGLRPLRSFRSEGAPVEVVRLRAVDDEVAAIADAIEADLAAGLRAEDIAVLVRSFRPVGPLIVGELRRRSIPVASIGREELLADTRVAALRAALDVLDRPHDAQCWSRLLTSAALRFDPIRVRFASAHENAGGRNAAAPGFARDDRNLGALDDASLGATLDEICTDGIITGTELANALVSAAQAWRAGDLGGAARRLVRRLRLLAAVLRDERPDGVRVAAARLKLVCDALAGAQRTAAALQMPARCGELVARFEELLPALALDDAGLDAGAPGVRVLTVHAAKGLEFARVFVADAVGGRFPQDARASTLLETSDRELLARRGCDGPSVAPEAAAPEEASLWYVALTRCKQRLTISFAEQALNGDAQRPSRFIPVDRTPSLVRAVERESLPMRVLRGGDAALRARLAISGMLDDAPAMADFARWGADALAPLAGHPVRGRRTLGVGDAELWLQCPRRLFYKRFARLPDEESAALTLGATLHVVFEAFHAAHGQFDARSIDVDGWTAELLLLRREKWNAERFASAVLARAAERAADVTLESYGRALAKRVEQTPFRVESRERAIEVVTRVGGHALSGRVDRIDVLPGGTRVIVDYKLGSEKKTSVTKAAGKILAQWAAAHDAQRPPEPLVRRAPGDLRLQLGFYAAALERVSHIAYVYLGGTHQPPQRNGAVYVLEPFGEELRAIVAAALDEIEAGLLTPLADGSLRAMPVTRVPETCTFCPYQAVCPGPAAGDA